FELLPLRVHEFLAGVPLHDAWTVELPKSRDGITLARFLSATSASAFTPSPIVRLLLRLRFFVGGIFGWDHEQAETNRETFVTRLTADDCARSLVPPGTRKGSFRVVYRFDNEEVAEIVNATVHAAMLSALVETPTSYRYYLGVYVQPVSRLTATYMALIDPVRRFIVYPSLLRSVATNWKMME
ncbi:MAG TPA: DUF2867 domain-containing protein, partial [Candidatus Baltobacteraceae bacterium]|nr:DUF2867 domain-containing protein [Candidatus Baltobacteraceae bacterium]